ncbi:TPA: hypothetical protein I9281_001299 [Serratia marcescens]|nr:hypothetical protein [Serratia marcescens]
MAIYDGYGTQQFYFSNVLKYDPDQLRSDLAGPGGAGLVFNGSTSVASQLNDLTSSVSALNQRVDWTTPEEHGAIGDGVTDDTAAMNDAVGTGKDVRLKPGATYLISSPIIFPYTATMQNFEGSSALIKSNANFLTFRQKLADATINDVTTNKNFFNVRAQGNAHARSIYSQVAASQFLKISNGMAINCSAVGFNNALSLMGNARAVNLYADDIRNAALRAEGDNNFFMGLSAGWVAGDVVLIKSNNSYFGNLFCQHAGISPPDTEEPETLKDQGAMVSFAQDGQNAIGNIVDTCHCQNYGGAFAVFSGSFNKMTGSLYGGKFDESRRAKGAGNAIYMSGVSNSIADVQFDLVYSGIEMHTGSQDCVIGYITIERKSSFGTYAISINGTTTDCSIRGLHVKRGLSKSADAYLGTDGTSIGELKLENFSGPTSGASPVRVLGANTIDRLYVSQSSSATTTFVNVIFQGNARIRELCIDNCLGTSLSVASGVTPMIDKLTINPDPTSTATPCLFNGSATDSRVVGQMTIRGGSAISPPRANGVLRITGYSGPSWVRADSSITGTVYYSDQTSHSLS